MKNKAIYLITLCLFFIMSYCGSSFAQCFGIQNRESGRIWFKGTEQECKAKWAKCCERPSQYNYIGEQFGMSQTDEKNLKDGLWDAKIQNFINSNEIISLDDENCNQSQISSYKDTYDGMKDDFHNAVDEKSRQDKAIWDAVNRDPTYQRTSTGTIGELPPKVTGNLGRPVRQNTQSPESTKYVTYEKQPDGSFLMTGVTEAKPCEYHKIFSESDYIALATEYFKLGYRLEYYAQKHYDEIYQSGCIDKEKDLSIFYNKLKEAAITISPSMVKFEPELDLALLSNNVYNDDGAPEVWKRVINFLDDTSSFFAALYQNIADTSIYVLAFRGSMEGQDFLVDYRQAFYGQEDIQYSQATETINQVTDYLKNRNANLYLTGHSLGGGLASYAHITAPKNSNIIATYTFNSAAIHERKYNAVIERNSEDNIYAYHSNKDKVTLGQKIYNEYKLYKALPYVATTIEVYADANLRRGFIKLMTRRGAPLYTLGNEVELPVYDETSSTFWGHSMSDLENYFKRKYADLYRMHKKYSSFKIDISQDKGNSIE